MNKDLEAFLKDPKGWVKRQKQLNSDKVRDLMDYRERQRQILEDTYNERVYELDREEAGVLHRARRWAAQYGIAWEETNDRQNNNL